MVHKSTSKSLVELAQWFWNIDDFDESKNLRIDGKIVGVVLYKFDSTTRVYVYNCGFLDKRCIKKILNDLWGYNIYTVCSKLASDLANIGHDYQYDGDVYVAKRNALGCLLK